MDNNQQFEENLHDILNFDSGISSKPVSPAPPLPVQKPEKIIQPTQPINKRKSGIELIIRIVAGIAAFFLLISFGVKTAFQ